MKKKYVILFFVLIICLCSCLLPFGGNIVFAEDEDIEDQLEEQISDDLVSFDFSELDTVLDNFGIEAKNIFGTNSFLEKIQGIISGDVAEEYDSVFGAILDLILDNILDFVPLLCSMIAVVILCSFINQLKSNLGAKSVSDIIFFVCYGIVIVIIASCVAEIMSLTSGAILSMKSQMEVIFPILLTLMTSVGGIASVGIYQPSIIIMSSVVMQIFNAILLPLFLITFIFTIVQNLSNSIQLSKFCNFFSSAFKWILGSVFTIFFAYITIQGLVANTFDTVSIRTAKFTIGSYVPFVGGYLSQGFDLILGSSVLIKNAVGASGLFLIIATILIPIIKIVVMIFGFKLTSAILEPISDNRISNFIQSVSKTLGMLVACILSVAFMYMLTVGLLMCSCNVF